MKKVIIGISVTVVVLFVLLQWSVARSTGNTPKYPYSVDTTFSGIEIRTYDEAIFARVEMKKSDYKSMSSQGFRVLADYIFGNNEKSEKISMTSPVLMEMNEVYTVEFMMPEPYDTSSLPTPANAKIEFITRPSWKAAAIEFGGYADDEKIEQKIAELKQVLDKNDFTHQGNFKFLGYNPPYQFFNRRNEVVVELE